MHAEEQVVQLRDRNAELLLDLLRIEAGVMRHLDRASRAIDGNGWGIVACCPNCGRVSPYRQDAGVGDRQRQVAVVQALAL